MNRPNIEALITLLKTLPPERFNMDYFIVAPGVDDLDPLNVDELPASILNTHCGTAGCLAGWTNALFNPNARTDKGFAASAAEYLSLSSRDAGELFYPNEAPRANWSTITRAEAIKVLRHLLKTGDVNWGLIK